MIVSSAKRIRRLVISDDCSKLSALICLFADHSLAAVYEFNHDHVVPSLSVYFRCSVVMSEMMPIPPQHSHIDDRRHDISDFKGVISHVVFDYFLTLFFFSLSLHFSVLFFCQGMFWRSVFIKNNLNHPLQKQKPNKKS